jgi:anti-anti-sigma factor
MATPMNAVPTTTAAPRFQSWNSNPFNIERKLGSVPGTVVLRFCGPFTVRDAYTCLPPEKLNRILELEPEPGEDAPVKNILDLTDCPYMDSSGLGMIVTHHVRCQKKGVRVVAAAMSPRVREIFRMTKVDTIIPIATSLEEAEKN